MNDIIKLVNMLEYRFYNVAFGDEKGYILELLQLYYPIIMRSMSTKQEIRQSKMNLYSLESDCMHNELIKDTNTRYLYKCAKCGKTIFK